jgi:hypothetical protein
MPDLFLRTALWARLRGRYRLNLYVANNLPANGPVILASNATRLEAGYQILSATDRTARFVMMVSPDERLPGRLTRWVASVSSLAWLKEDTASDADKEALETVNRVLARGEVLGLPLPDPISDPERANLVEKAYAKATSSVSATILPVSYTRGEPEPRRGIRPVNIVFGKPLPAGVSLQEVRLSIGKLRTHFHGHEMNGDDESTLDTDLDPDPARPVLRPSLAERLERS